MQLSVGDLVFDAREAGPADGRPVVLLHGFPESSLCWAGVLDRLAADGFRAVAPDLRGYSPGARPTDVAAYAMPRLVEDVLGLADALGADRLDLVGHDWGSAVAWHVAARHPERLRSLVAVSVPHPLALSYAMRHDPDQQAKSAYIRLFRLDGVAEEQLLEDDARRLRRAFAGSGMSPSDVDGYVRPLQEPGALTAALAWYRAASRDDVRDLDKVAVPTTYVWGEQDVAIGRVAAEGCAAWMSGPYRFVPLAEVSHWVPEQVPDRLADEILARLATT